MQAKRGYVPKDDRYFSASAQKTLREACEHVCYLIDNGYGLKQASTFVGDHFQLSERQRTAILRTVATNGQLADRRRKEVPMSCLRDQEVCLTAWTARFVTSPRFAARIASSR